MAIHLEDLNNTDFAEVVTGRPLQPVRPGDILLHEFMEPFGLTANALAKAIRVPANRITGILAAARGITADTALRLSQYFGTTPQFWMNLQSNYDLSRAKAKVGSRIAREIERNPAATLQI